MLRPPGDYTDLTRLAELIKFCAKVRINPVYRTCILKNSQQTTPRQTEIFRECFVPACGTSRAMSAYAITSSPTPRTSLPNTRQYFMSGFSSQACKGTLSVVCSTTTIRYPESLSFFTATTGSASYSQATDSVAPSAVLLISRWGGCPVMPVSTSRSIPKASHVRKAEPTL